MDTVYEHRCHVYLDLEQITVDHRNICFMQKSNPRYVLFLFDSDGDDQTYRLMVTHSGQADP